MTRFLALLATALPLLAATGPASAAAPSRPQVPAGMTAAYAVFDRQTGKVTSYRNVHRRFRSASVVKIMIAIDYLESHSSVPRKDLALLTSMLRVSDDDAATSFWTRGGQGKIIERMARRLRLTDTAPPPADLPGFWGYTSLSALDVVRTYRYLLDQADPKVSGLILGHLRKAGQCGSDGFDQYFGIPRGVVRPWAVKQGWSGYGETPPVRCKPATAHGSAPAPAPGQAPAAGTAAPARVATTVAAAGSAAGPVPDLGHPVLHTTGLVGPKERWIMVLLTAHPAGTSWQRSTGQVTKLAGEVYLSGAR
ncbi:hypothetical protein [Streptosporangium sp. NBC_01756]|uniref:hypothetical protein n=1 Tax=Streptosporangium sp. NBC_01756 TaxID=2975950 RepID=UPI002DDAEDC4|nr:hypothetical protein [Streptosporangium sp. NBC_01756]WSC86001.1 hypothetical protein OIE48_37490 [Streptosporangium sp. NBC_01756]